jgi:hypothetical protein
VGTPPSVSSSQISNSFECTTVRRIKTTFIHARPATLGALYTLVLCWSNAAFIISRAASGGVRQKVDIPARRHVMRVRRIGCITRKMRDKIAPCAFHTPRVQCSPYVTFLYLSARASRCQMKFRSLFKCTSDARAFSTLHSLISHTIKFSSFNVKIAWVGMRA